MKADYNSVRLYRIALHKIEEKQIIANNNGQF